jgi:ribosomal protein S18 acetylase RimI-like enzyme
MAELFRPATAAEVGPAHALYMDLVGWLKAKNIRQWLRPLTKEEFAERQARGELFALFLDDQMAAHAALAFEEDTDWREHLDTRKRWWIKTLAVSRAHSGRGLGAKVVELCEAFVRQSGGKEIYLECVDAGYLPDYYARLGYELLVRANITYPSGNTFLVALMRKRLG